MTPVELGDFVKAQNEDRREREKEEWRRAAFLASWIINTAGKSYTRNFSAEDLVRFQDEAQKEGIEPIDPEERKRQADETFSFHKSKAWTLIRSDADGGVKVFDEAELERMKERFRKKG